MGVEPFIAEVKLGPLYKHLELNYNLPQAGSFLVWTFLVKRF
jgi:hypothetical protein